MLCTKQVPACVAYETIAPAGTGRRMQVVYLDMRLTALTLEKQGLGFSGWEGTDLT
jgi:hypothetical protein